MAKLDVGTLSLAKAYANTLEVQKMYFGNIELYSAQEKLDAPTLSISGDTLTITDNSQIATSFDIYVDGVYATNVSNGEFSLSVSASSSMSQGYLDIKYGTTQVYSFEDGVEIMAADGNDIPIVRDMQLCFSYWIRYGYMTISKNGTVIYNGQTGSNPPDYYFTPVNGDAIEVNFYWED